MSGARAAVVAPGEMRKLEELYRLCFDDGDDFTERLFARGLRDAVGLCINEGGEPVSSLMLLPFEVRLFDGRERAHYLYAACTHPTRRGRGLMRELCAQAREYSRAAGADMVLTLPQSDGLYGFYAALGFYELPGFDAVRVTADEAARCDAGGCEADYGDDAYALAYAENAGARVRTAVHGGGSLRFMLDDNRREGGVSAVLRCGGECGYFAARPQGEYICVRDAALPGATLTAALGIIARRYGKRDVVLRFPAGLVPQALEGHMRSRGRYGMGARADGCAVGVHMSMMYD